ncbi:hypothetical protein [Actinokineospora diospyrosa]|uniref:Sugar lactone lactonase YvrE n=1 Tax=Actinokineospora diospyrosa TaxID=103728 RepID=A0ABT1IBN9_9PSEU|nr:hypothetical protein [Actinokineospora diospyrosa]MCP2269974.1 hypothetical protein [Actinokineospora diospyrosa]
MTDRCVAALPSGWLVLGEAGLVEIADDGARHVRGQVALAGERAQRERLALHTSADGRFAAVVADYGQAGAVVDLTTGTTTFELDRGDYCAAVTPFPIAFVGSGVETVLVAASQWNRLDLYDPATGGLLTAREFDEDDELDYFHGALTASPSGRWLLDDGWVWQPAAAQVVIDVAAWRAGEVYAAEADLSVGYPRHWDRPVAWLDDGLVAVQGNENLTVVEVPSGRTKWTVDGVEGPMWSHRGVLHVAAPDGLEIFSTATRARVAALAGFRPVAQNRATGALAEVADGVLRSWQP